MIGERVGLCQIIAAPWMPAGEPAWPGRGGACQRISPVLRSIGAPSSCTRQPGNRAPDSDDLAAPLPLELAQHDRGLSEDPALATNATATSIEQCRAPPSNRRGLCSGPELPSPDLDVAERTSHY